MIIGNETQKAEAILASKCTEYSKLTGNGSLLALEIKLS